MKCRFCRARWGAADLTSIPAHVDCLPEIDRKFGDWGKRGIDYSGVKDSTGGCVKQIASEGFWGAYAEDKGIANGECA